jgi:mono/diheme cytochrome c family protein
LFEHDLFGKPDSTFPDHALQSWIIISRGKIIMQFCKVFALVTTALFLGTVACHAADAEHGRDLAKRWCASCHVVSSDQARANADAPPFATIARSPNFDAKRLAYFLLDPHPKMPDLPLSRAAAEDVVAYIETLRR